MEDTLVPIALFTVIGVTMCLSFYFRHRTRLEIQTTVRAAIERGQELTPEVLEGLSDALNPRHGDLRRGVISVALGIAFALFGILLGEEDAQGPLLAVSAFPFIVGLGYLALWFFIKRKPSSS
jgi:hypothetical protein